MSLLPTTAPSLTGADLGTSSGDGFADLTSEDFLQLLIVQLQNQDPSEPLSNDQLMSQISEIRNIEASTSLEQTLERLADSDGLTTAASYLGKVVAGADSAGNSIAGIADRAFVADGQPFVEVLGVAVKLDDVLEVADPLTVAESYVGNLVTGTTSGGVQVNGIAERAVVDGGVVYVEVGSQRLSLREVESVSTPQT
ncbi:MAG: flagellar hook capping FlgD N-terminal domain-containing protein [Planctomycetota bacterium]